MPTLLPSTIYLWGREAFPMTIYEPHRAALLVFQVGEQREDGWGTMITSPPAYVRTQPRVDWRETVMCGKGPSIPLKR